jgi:hypothetical protein
MKIYFTAKSIPEFACMEKAEQKAILSTVAKKSFKHWQTQIAFAIWAAIGVITVMKGAVGTISILLVPVIVYISGILFTQPYFRFMRRYVIEYIETKEIHKL